jgi:hypothetical protein
MDTAYPIDKISNTRHTPLGENGIVNTINPELYRYGLLNSFSTQNGESRLGGKPLNPGRRNIFL